MCSESSYRDFIWVSDGAVVGDGVKVLPTTILTVDNGMEALEKIIRIIHVHD